MKLELIVEEKSYADLDEDYKRLLDEAERQMKENSYNPYSGFFVGSAVLAEDGEIFGGANQEDASYTLSIHAEQAALVNAAAHGRRKIKAIAVIGKGTDKDGKPYNVETPQFPCGLCRQTIHEHVQPGGDIYVITASTDKKVVYVAKASGLLPLAFGREVLRR